MKVAYGFFSFTEVTDPGEHRSYNEWHQLDHLPEQFPLAGIVSGQRWVSTPACRLARAASDPALDPVHYVTCYLMAEPIETTIDEFFALGAELHRLDRFHQHRRAHLTGPFRVLDARAAPRVLVSAAALPFRAHRGIYVTVEDLGDDANPESERPDDVLLGVPGVAGYWTFATVDGMTSRRWTAGRRRITVCWLDDDPLAVAARLAPLVTARRSRGETGSRLTFAGPLETITPWQWDWFDQP
jgi:hypothetical protein